jgi:hypothetical protein
VSPLTHDEIKELLGAYALHAVDPDEAELVERHLEGCPRCRSEVAGHREVATLLGNTGGDAPEGLWDRIASQLEEAPPPMRLRLPAPEGAEVTPLASRRRQRGNRYVVAAIGAAAALVVAALGVQVVRQDDRIAELEAAMAGASSAEATVATLASPDGALSAEAVLLPNGTGYLLAGDLPGLDEDQTYQLWGVTQQGVVSLGLLGSDPGDVMPFQAGDAQDVSALAVTQEVAGGVTQSTNAAVVAGAFD